MPHEARHQGLAVSCKRSEGGLGLCQTCEDDILVVCCEEHDGIVEPSEGLNVRWGAVGEIGKLQRRARLNCIQPFRIARKGCSGQVTGPVELDGIERRIPPVEYIEESWHSRVLACRVLEYDDRV